VYVNVCECYECIRVYSSVFECMLVMYSRSVLSGSVSTWSSNVWKLWKLRIVQDFRELNQNSHIDKYSMKEITECIGDIGRANSTIFTTLDLTSGFWQMQLDEDSQKLTAFTIPSKGQFHWITSPMGLLGCPASFQRLMEGVLRDIPNVLVYIDDLLVHTDSHDKHLQVLDQGLA